MPETKSGKRDSLAQRVRHQLREQIMQFEKRPGERIGEAEICEEFNVSRTPAREALKQLCDDRLLVATRSGSYQVAGLTHVDVDELCDALAELDTYLCRQASINRTDPKLVAITQRMQEAATSQDTKRWSDLDQTFHQLVNAAANNEWIAELNRLTRFRIQRFWIVTERTERLSACSQEHVALAQAIVEGDADHAEKLVREHVEHMRESLHSMLRAVNLMTVRPS